MTILIPSLPKANLSISIPDDLNKLFENESLPEVALPELELNVLPESETNNKEEVKDTVVTPQKKIKSSYLEAITCSLDDLDNAKLTMIIQTLKTIKNTMLSIGKELK